MPFQNHIMTDLSLPERYPAAGQDRSDLRTTQGEQDGGRKAAAIRVLYVDDEPDLLEIGRLFLEDDGDFAVMTIMNAPDAIRLLEQEPFDAIISDYQMPVMDGLQFLVEVRASSPDPVHPVHRQGQGGGGHSGDQQRGRLLHPERRRSQRTVRRTRPPGKAGSLPEEGGGFTRKSEEDYRHLIEYSDEAIGIIQDGMIRRVNHSIVALTGYPEQELLSMPFSRFIHPNDREMVVERYEKRMRGEEAPSQYSIPGNRKGRQHHLG